MTTPEEKQAGYISLKEASERFGYSQDYLGQLIRKGKLEGKLVYSHVAWVTTPEAIEEYITTNKNKKTKNSGKNAVLALDNAEAKANLKFKSDDNTSLDGHEFTRNFDFDAGLILDEDLPPSRTANLLIILFRGLLLVIVMIAIFVFYLLTTAFGEEIKVGSRIAHASGTFSLSFHADHHE